MSKKPPRKGPREANRVTREEARRLDANAKMGWKQWEQKVDHALRLNKWTVWKDRVLPKRFGDAAQYVGRKRGLPDRLVGKRFADPSEIPVALKVYPASLAGPISVVGFVEAKTGRATTTPDQDRWLELANLCPGMFAVTVYPADYDYLVEILGGERGAY